MRKGFSKKCFAALVIAGLAGYNVYLSNSNESAMSDVSLANVEALADGEISKGDSCYKGSYNSTLPLAVSCGTPCTYDHKGGLTDKCS
ncbi:MAG: NVEALA domain-containing protein [Dysgonamonadaceae bacterium]|jgi:hypothetical protein|nr:NVEALA domain-containing protein [Dysgonamonadaceae bacterium]